MEAFEKWSKIRPVQNDLVCRSLRIGWENALSSSLGYFESEDQFELCKDINTTLKMLRHERTTKPIKRIP